MKKAKFNLIGWIFAGIAGLIIFMLLFSHAFPIASINIKLSKQDIIDKATVFINSQGFDLDQYEMTMLFDSDYYTSVYLQKTQGMKKANELIAEGIPVWYWSIRWFKELEKEGFYCAVDPQSGEIVYFEHFLLDDAKGANLSKDEAVTLAKQKVIAQGVDIKAYELKEDNVAEQKNRTDYQFIWEKQNYAIDDAHLRYGVSIYGDTTGSFAKYLDIPEQFVRDLKKEVSFGRVLSMITLVLIFLLFIAAIVTLVIQFKYDKVNWKFGLFFGVSVCLLAITDFVNNIPLLWNAYPDTSSKAVFLSVSMGSALIGSLMIGLLIFLFGASGESLSREVIKSREGLFDFIWNKKTKDKDLVSPFVIGYCLGFIFLGYVTLFYVIGTKFFNIWMPPEVEYSNMLGTTLPFLFPLTVAVSASVSEEFMFRLFSISFFKKYFKRTWLAVLIPAVIWAFAHSNYPVFPAYVRGIELTIAGVVFGIAFLRYGLATALIAHFVIDAALVGLPLIKSQDPYFKLSGIIVISIALMPGLVMALIAKKKRAKVKE